jgi:hypothetical protein
MVLGLKPSLKHPLQVGLWRSTLDHPLRVAAAGCWDLLVCGTRLAEVAPWTGVDALTIHRTELARATLHAARVAWPLARCAFGMVPGSGRGFQITTPWRGKPSAPSI